MSMSVYTYIYIYTHHIILYVILCYITLYDIIINKYILYYIHLFKTRFVCFATYIPDASKTSTRLPCVDRMHLMYNNNC